jgi:hypothetical protein
MNENQFDQAEELLDESSYENIEIIYEGKKVVAQKTIEGDILIQGDIIIDHHLYEVEPGLLKGSWDTAVKKWDSTKKIPYEIDPNMSEQMESLIRDAIHHLEVNTNLRFKEHQSEDDYIFFEKNTYCASSVGRKGSKQYIRLSNSASKGNIMHEICHAIGMHHEHCRNDRDEFIEILMDNIAKEESKHNFDKKPNGEDFGDYDYDSIMHYSSKAFAKSGTKTIRPLIDVEIGQRNHLSAGDISMINELYKETTTV